MTHSRSLVLIIGAIIFSIIFLQGCGATPTSTKNTSAWTVVGSPGISLGPPLYISLDVNTGVPYIAYIEDLGVNKRAIVKTFTGTSWEAVGGMIFPIRMESAPLHDYADRISLYVHNSTPYLAYQDIDQGHKVTVKKYTGVTWEVVGSAGFSVGTADSISLFINNSIPYVAFSDEGNGNKASVYKYNGSAWELVGDPAFTGASARLTYLHVDNSIPYIAYIDGENADELTIRKYSGSTWEVVGSAGISEDSTGSPSSIYVYNGVPYIYYGKSDYSSSVIVRKYSGSTWEVVGDTSIYTYNYYDYNDNDTEKSLCVNNGTPYIIYHYCPDNHLNFAAKYNGTSWETIGNQGFKASLMTLDVYSDSPYIAFRDSNGGLTVIKYNQ